MSLLAIKGVYENGHITLEENIISQKPMTVIVTFLEENTSKLTAINEWEQWFASLSQFSDDFMANGREQPATQERDWSGLE
jgi:hypothetical protein